MPDTATSFGELIAARIHAEHISISARWLERLRDLLTVDANQVFPTEHLLDHVPTLIQQIAEYVRTPETESVSANTFMTAKAQELGELRHLQRASVHQLLAEYRLLGGILSHFVQDELERLGVSPAASEAIDVMRRISEAIWMLMQTTVDTFVSEYTGTIASHAARIEGFHRMVSHELRQPLGTLVYAVPLLRASVADGDASRQEHLLAVMERNGLKLTQLIDQLETLSRLQAASPDRPDVQRSHVGSIAWDVARQLREMADSREVEVHIEDDLPELMIDRARLELILTNLISNAIKYSDPGKPSRSVRIEAAPPTDPAATCFVVKDNGIGIPPDSLPTVFGRFVRAHASRDGELGVRGSGLGLAIAAECAEAVGGSIRVESTQGAGTAFFVEVPRTLVIAPDARGSADHP